MSDRSGRAGGDWRRLARLGGAFGLLIAGLVVLASGSANVAVRGTEALGLSPGRAQEVGYAIGAAIPLVVLMGVFATVGTEDEYRRSAYLAIAIATGGVVVGLGTPMGIGDPLVTGLYGLGVVVAVGTLFRGILESVRSDRTPSTHPTTQYRQHSVTDRSSLGDRSLPADGGDEDDDLEFPLDEEE